MSMKQLVVIGARCIIKEVILEATTKAGIILAPSNVEKTYTGKVVVIGDGAWTESGIIKPMTVAVGDTVLYAKFAGTVIKHDNEEFIILNERDILVIVKPEV